MADYITVAEVRRVCGIPSTDINDTDMGAFIDAAEKNASRFLNVVFVPTEDIEVRDGDGTARLITLKKPLLALRELKIDGTSVTINDNIEFEKNSGYIELDNIDGSPEVSYFKSKTKKTIVRYLHGWVEPTSTSTTTDTDAEAGSSVDLSVASETGFSDDDWVEIYGMDGNYEVAQITGTDTGEITVDELSYDHDSSSKVIKVTVPEDIKEIMRVVAGIGAVARIVGESADDTTGYTLGELSVQKGEPYTQWRETANQLIKQRDEMVERLRWRTTSIQ